MKKGFTFVELLLVMLVLGIIISLTLPIIKNIKDDDDIYRAYMKKANQDVTDAINMISIKENKFRGMSTLLDGTLSNINANYSADATGMRNLFNAGLGGLKCGECSDNIPGGVGLDPSKCYLDNGNLKQCIISAPDFRAPNGIKGNNNPGLVLGGKPVMIFQLNANGNLCNYPQNLPSDNNVDLENKIYGCVFVDVNKDKSPNECCKDRYKFIVYNDRVAMETTGGVNNCGCTFEMGN